MCRGCARGEASRCLRPSRARSRLSTTRKGASSEATARAFLEGLGLHILAQNQRFDVGELDLVAEDRRAVAAAGGDAVLVFVEVRSRASDDLGTPAETVNARKQRRVARAAQAWLLANPAYQGRAMRFDVVGITWDGEPPRIEHVVDAFDDVG